MRTTKLAILLCATVLLLQGCPDKPTPWTPDNSAGTDLRGDASSLADGTGKVDGIKTDTPLPVDVTSTDDVLNDQIAVPDTKADLVVPVDTVAELVEEDVVDVVEEPDVPVDAPCTPACGNDSCGPDGCGGVCGSCGDGESCFFGQCVVLSGGCDDGNDVDWDGCTEGFESEFQVNVANWDDQRQPAVVATGESFVIVWQSCEWNEWEGPVQGHDGLGCGIVARRIFPGDMAKEDEYPVNEITQQNQLAPDIAALGENLVMTWLSYDSGDEWQIKLRVFNDAGIPLSPEIAGNAKDHQPYWKPVVAASGNEQVLVAWMGIKELGGLGVMGQYFHWDGLSGSFESVGTVIELKTSQTVDTYHPRIATLADGSFVTAWGAEVGGAAYVDVFGHTATYPSPPEGNDFLLFTDGGDGAAQDEPDVVSTGFGSGFLTVYRDNGFSQNEMGLSARLFTSAGQPVGVAKPLVVTPPQVALPAVSVKGNGAAFLAWGTHFDSGEGEELPWQDEIRVAELSPTLTLGAVTTANLHVGDYQKFARVATNTNTGHSIVVWESCPWDQTNESLDLPGQDGDGCGIFGRIYQD